MKTIEPVKIWYNGQEVDATILIGFVFSDNLSDSAVFGYKICMPNPVLYPNTSPTYLIEGSLNMSGQDYQDWDNNEYAYNWIANQLNLTITGDYVPPVPPTPEPTPNPITAE
jgi:hypothetical protein